MNTVFVSQFQRAGYSEKAEVIYNGIPLDKWDNPNFSAGRYLVFLGAINETKGTYEAIKAALLANESIVVAGTTDESGDYFQRSINPFIDGDRVKYIGSLNFEQKKQPLVRGQGGLNANPVERPAPDSCSRVLASGTPIIAWDRSSMGEIIENGVSGFLISSIEEMAARIKDLGKIDRRACRSRAELLFDSKQMAKNYVSLYQTLLGA